MGPHEPVCILVRRPGSDRGDEPSVLGVCEARSDSLPLALQEGGLGRCAVKARQQHPSPWGCFDAHFGCCERTLENQRTNLTLKFKLCLYHTNICVYLDVHKRVPAGREHLVKVEGQPVHDHVQGVVEGEVVGHDGPHCGVAEQGPPGRGPAGQASPLGAAGGERNDGLPAGFLGSFTSLSREVIFQRVFFFLNASGGWGWPAGLAAIMCSGCSAEAALLARLCPSGPPEARGMMACLQDFVGFSGILEFLCFHVVLQESGLICWADGNHGHWLLSGGASAGQAEVSRALEHKRADLHARSTCRCARSGLR